MENLKIGTITFSGNADDKNTYVLAININNVVYIRRNFKGSANQQNGVPSGWVLDRVQGLNKLCIDGGQNWYVYPTQEAWDELLTLKR